MSLEDETTYHIYARDRCIYHNLRQEDFEEKWELLNVMVGLLHTDYTEDDLSFEKAAPTVGVGGPVRINTEPPGDDSYCNCTKIWYSYMESLQGTATWCL